MASHFWVTGHWVTGRMAQDLERWKVRGTPYTCYTYPWVPHFTLRPAVVELRSFWDKPHIPVHVTTASEPQIPLFCSTADIFELQAILRQVHQMTPNDLQHLKIEGTLNTCYNYPRIPRFTPFRSTASRIRVTAHFETNPPNGPQMTFNTKRSQAPDMPVTTTSESQISPFRSTASHFWVTRHYETCTPNEPQNDLQH